MAAPNPLNIWENWICAQLVITGLPGVNILGGRVDTNGKLWLQVDQKTSPDNQTAPTAVITATPLKFAS